jgi:hypothetical protein
MRWREALQASLHFAAAHGICVFEHSMHAATRATVESRCVEAIRVQGWRQDDAPGTMANLGVYEIVREAKIDEEAEYRFSGLDVLAHNESHDLVTKALQECLDGRFAEAMALLDGVPDEDVRAAALVRRLRDRAENCILRGLAAEDFPLSSS